jgi:hypothetical protein
MLGVCRNSLQFSADIAQYAAQPTVFTVFSCVAQNLPQVNGSARATHEAALEHRVDARLGRSTADRPAAGDVAERARQIHRLLARWLTVVPNPILEVTYEALVANLETESRRLIEFLGLEWDPACLTLHETERPVMTASVWQVRRLL